MAEERVADEVGGRGCEGREEYLFDGTGLGGGSRSGRACGRRAQSQYGQLFESEAVDD